MIGDQADPLGDAGLNVDPEIADTAAAGIREILSRSGQEAKDFDETCNHDHLFAAWRLLNARERAAWTALVKYARAYT